MKKIIEIDEESIVLLKDQAGQLLLNPQADEALAKLLDLKDLIDETIEQVKENILSSAESTMANFRTVVGDKTRATYRAYGDRYTIVDEALTDQINVIKHISIRPNVAEIEKYEKKHKKLPAGIDHKPQIKKLVITRV